MSDIGSLPVDPSEEEKKQGSYFGLWIGGGKGMPSEIIEASTQSKLWRCKETGLLAWKFPIYPFFKPEFVVTNPVQEEVLRIRRVGGFIACFELLENTRVVGTIRYRNAWRTRCTISLEDGSNWEMYQPLYTIYFRGESDHGERVYIGVGPRKNQWNLLVPPSGANVRLLSALALMHREYWTH